MIQLIMIEFLSFSRFIEHSNCNWIGFYFDKNFWYIRYFTEEGFL